MPSPGSCPAVRVGVPTQVEQKRSHDKRCKAREFLVGQRVLVRNVRDGSKWLPGEICTKTGPVSYEVNVDGQRWRRHAEQMLSLADNEYSQPDSQHTTELPAPRKLVFLRILPVVDNVLSWTQSQRPPRRVIIRRSANSPEAEL